MEQPDIEIKDLEITDIDFKIIYQNDAIEIIEKNKLGITINPENIDKLLETIIKLVQQTENIEKIKENCIFVK